MKFNIGHVLQFRCILTLFISILLSSCAENPKKSEEKNNSFILNDSMASKIEIAEVTEEKIKGNLILHGKVTADENNVMDVYPLIGGRVKDIYALLGEFVKKGQTLAIVNSPELASLEKEWKEALQNLELSEKTLKNSLDLFEGKLISEKELLPIKYEVEKNRISVRKLEESRKIFGDSEKSEYVIKAPMSGYIIKKNVSKDQNLREDNSESIYTIADISTLWVLGDVYETDMAKIHEGLEVEIELLSFQGKFIKSKIDKIFNSVDEQTQTLKARAIINNDKDFSIKPEMNAVINLLFDEDRNLPMIPSQSVIFDKNKHFVMVFQNNSKIETRQIEIYSIAGSKTFVKSGLQVGEKIISKEQLFVYDAIND